MKLVIQNSSKVWGGNEKWLSILASGLLSRGHQVIVSCASGPVREKLRDRGVRVTSHRPRGAIDAPSAIDFAAFLASERPDALLLTSWRTISWSVFAASLANVPRIVMRLGIVRPFPDDLMRARAMRSVDALIVNSEEIRDVWLDTRPAEMSQDVTVVMNAITSTRERRKSLQDSLRNDIAAPPGAVLVGGAGHLAPRKGFDVLIRAFGAAGVPNAQLLIIGDGEHRSELENLVSTMNLESSVKFLGHRENANEFITGLDIFVLSSHNEGMANVMLEAMAGGTPVIAADISGVRKAISATEDRCAAGWMFEAGNASQLAATIREVCELVPPHDPEVTRRVDEAHWRIENWFSTPRMIDECEAVLFPR